MKTSDKPYDNAARLLTKTGALSLCRWLDAPTNGPRLIDADLPSSTVYPDVVLALRPKFALHVEFQTDASVDIPLRVLKDPALAPFASLADIPAGERPEVLLRAARLVQADGRPELLHATRDLANIRLDRSTIDEVWKELRMPIPTSEQYRYDEGRAEGIAEALHEQFGDDDRIPEIARRLAAQGTGWFKRLTAANSLDDLWHDD